MNEVQIAEFKRIIYSKKIDGLFVKCRLNIIVKSLAILQKQGIKKPRLIDLGAGSGFYSKYLQERGYNVIGIDKNLDCTGEMGKKVIECLNGDAKNLPFCNKKFDGGLLIEVIEHVESPQELLFEINRVLKPGGVLTLTTPNGGRLLRRLLKVVGMTYNISPFHLTEFNSDEIIKLAERTGFEISDSYSYGMDIPTSILRYFPEQILEKLIIPSSVQSYNIFKKFLGFILVKR
jgi:2-polyprenyl-3-methyl-5-hydroxy-6-metoxy-1,4-benzoquinol methylase